MPREPRLMVRTNPEGPLDDGRSDFVLIVSLIVVLVAAILVCLLAFV